MPCSNLNSQPNPSSHSRSHLYFFLTAVLSSLIWFFFLLIQTPLIQISLFLLLIFSDPNPNRACISICEKGAAVNIPCASPLKSPLTSISVGSLTTEAHTLSHVFAYLIWKSYAPLSLSYLNHARTASPSLTHFVMSL